MLTPEKRTQLDGIVMNMAKQNASQLEVQAIVNDFKSKFDVIEQPVGQPEDKGLGGKLLERGKDIVSAIAPKKPDEMSTYEKSTKVPLATLRVAGAVAGGIGDVIGAGISKGYEKLVPEKAKEKIKQTGIDILQTPAGQAGLEAIKGGVEIYQKFKQDNPNVAKDLEAVVNVASLLPIGKAISGVKIGKAISGVKTIASKEKMVEKSFLEAAEVTSKTLNKKQTINIFEESGKTGKGLEEKGLFKKISPVMTKQDEEVARSVQGFVKKSSSAAENIGNINKEISRISENEIKPFLEKNNAIFNKNTLNARLKKIEIPDWIKSDKTLENTYNLVRKRMIDIVDKSPKNMSGLWEARKEFDRVIKEQFGDAVFEKQGASNTAFRDMRKELNNFISEKTPNGNELFKGRLRTLSNMYEARHRIAESSYKEIGKGKISRLAKRYPKTTKALKIGGTAVGGGIVANTILGQ